MPRYTGRSFGSGGSSTPSFFSLGKQLANRRGSMRPSSTHIAPKKPALITGKQKEEVLKESVEHYLPSGLKLAKLRQLAAQHKIMGERARKFLQETESGNRIQGKEALVKLDADMLEAESQAVSMQTGHDPRKYEFRKEEDHPERLAKKLVKGLYHEAAQQAKEATMKQNVVDERRAHHAMIDSLMNRQQAAQAPAQSSSIGSHSTSAAPQAIVEPTPLHHVAGSHASTMVPMVGGGHITQSSTPATPSSPISVGIPVAARTETPSSATPTDTSTPSEAVPATTGEPVSAPTTEPSVQLPDMSHISDPFGGEE